LLAAVSGRNLDQALQPTQKRTASCVQLYIAVQKLDLWVATAACENPEESRVRYPKQLFWWKIAKLVQQNPLNYPLESNGVELSNTNYESK